MEYKNKIRLWGLLLLVTAVITSVLIFSGRQTKFFKGTVPPGGCATIGDYDECQRNSECRWDIDSGCISRSPTPPPPQPKPDLIIVDGSVSRSPDPAIKDSPITFSATVKNIGTANAPSTNTDLYIRRTENIAGATSRNLDTQHLPVSSGDLAINQQRTLSWTWQTSTTVGIYTFQICANTIGLARENPVLESNSNNNCSPEQEFRVYDTPYEPTCSFPGYINNQTVCRTNNGCTWISTSPQHCESRTPQPTTPLIAQSLLIQNFQSATFQQEDTTQPPPSQPPPSGQPNFTAESFTASSTNPRVGDTVTFSATIRNNGQAAGVPTPFIHFSNNGVETSPLPAPPVLNNIATNSTAPVSWTLPPLIAGQIGDWEVWICPTDADTNCTSRTTVHVLPANQTSPPTGSQPNFTVENTTISSNNLTVGSQFTLSATIRNNGTAAGTPNVVVHFSTNGIDLPWPSTTPINSIAAGAVAPVSWTSPPILQSQIGTWEIWICASSTPTSCGMHQTITVSAQENSGSQSQTPGTSSPQTQADFIIQSLTNPGTVTQGSTVFFSGMVKNNGSNSSSQIQARFCVDNQSCQSEGSGQVGLPITITNLGAGATYTVNSTNSWNATTSGNHTVTLCVNYGTPPPVSESNTSNNCDTRTFSVTSSSTEQTQQQNQTQNQSRIAVTRASDSPSGNVSAGVQNFAAVRFNFTNNSSTPKTINSITFNISGNATSSDIANFGIYDGGTQLGSTIATLIGSTLTFSNLAWQIPINQTKNLSFQLQILPTATANRTFSVGIINNSGINVLGEATIDGSFPINGNIITINAPVETTQQTQPQTQQTQISQPATQTQTQSQNSAISNSQTSTPPVTQPQQQSSIAAAITNTAITQPQSAPFTTPIASDPQPVYSAPQFSQMRASAPDLAYSQRLVRAPERGRTGPEVIVYFGILAAIQGGRWLRKKIGK